MKSNLHKARRRNAKLYPVYKMFSWDLLFFYAIEFLFCTLTKGISATQVLIASGLYRLFKVMCFVPATAISDIFGKRKSIILGNLLWIVHCFILIFLPGFSSIVLAYLVLAMGANLKSISESNLLYDSVSTKGGDGLYEKLDAKGGSLYYILDGIASLIAGYLFVVDNYLPVYICLAFIVVSTIISCFFKEIYEPSRESKGNEICNLVKQYRSDLKVSMKFILKSRRMKSYIIFGAVFYGIISIFGTYKSDLITDLGVSEEEFSMIYAILSLIGGFSIKLIKPLEKRFKNRVLTFLSLTFTFSTILIGFFVTRFTGKLIIPIVLLFYCLIQMAESIWYILEYKYLKHFTESEMRNKITLAYEFVGCITASIMAVLGGLLLEVVDIKNAFLLVGLASFTIMVLILDYMRTRFGLKAKEYRKEDIEFVEKEEEKITNE